MEDVDDTPPTFQKTMYNFHVSENQPAGTLVGQVKAEDKDSSSLNYQLKTSGKCYFSQFNLITSYIYIYMLSAIHILNIPDSSLILTLSLRINVRKIKLHLTLKLTV